MELSTLRVYANDMLFCCNDRETSEIYTLNIVGSVTMDPETGARRNLRLKANGGGGGGYHRIEDGHLLVQVDRIEARQDLPVRLPQEGGVGAPDRP